MPFLPALSIVEHPQRTEWAAAEQALIASTFHAQQDSGRYATYLEGGDQDQQHNYYPGETLLLWAALYREQRDPAGGEDQTLRTRMTQFHVATSRSPGMATMKRSLGQ